MPPARYCYKPQLIGLLQSSKRTYTTEEIAAEYQLVQAAQENPRRFDALYRRHHAAIFLYIYKRIPDEDQVADLTSQVFLKAMLNLKQYRFKGLPFSAWLYRIAINEVNQFFRQHNRRRTISIESQQLSDMAEEIIEGQFSEQDVQLLVNTLQQLSPEEVQLIELRYFERIPFKEIAEIYGITENNAKVRMHRLLGKVRKLMAKVLEAETSSAPSQKTNKRQQRKPGT